MVIETSLIIITRDRAALLERALRSLERQTLRLDEILVIDNPPTPGTAEVVRAFEHSLPVRYVPEPRCGYGAARNRGVREARGRALLFLDDDCRADPQWAETLVRELKDGAAEIVGGSRVCIQPGLAAHLDYLSTDAPVLHPRRPRGAASHLSTSNLALLREVVERVGPFDEALAMCEDRDFCARARALGFRVLYAPAARVEHQAPIHSFSSYFQKMRRYGLGTAQYFLKYRREEPLARIFPRAPQLRLLLLPVYAVLGTAYLVMRNLRHRPDALLFSPLLLLGQFFWHWGSYQAVRQPSSSC